MTSYISPLPLLFVFLALNCCCGGCFGSVVRGDDESLPAAPVPVQPIQTQTKPLGTRVETGGFSINNGYGLSAMLDHNGSPNANVKLYGGGKLGPGGAYYRDDLSLDAAAPQALVAENGRHWVGLGSAFVAGALLALAFWYGCLWLIGTKRLVDLEDLKLFKDNDKDVKSRKRRAIQTDAQLTRLADIVLSAVESGQCMERSICLLGTQLGAGSSKSMLAMAATVLEKMIPVSAQSSVYFVTLQHALRGKLNCDKIRCGGLVDSSK